MAITRRVTVTEHFSSTNADSNMAETQAPGVSGSSLQSVKNNFSDGETSATPTGGDPSDQHALITNNSSDPNFERFSKELSDWFWEHIKAILIGIFSVFASVGWVIWQVGSSVGKAEHQLEMVTTTVNELKTESKKNSDRLLTLEVRSEKNSKK